MKYKKLLYITMFLLIVGVLVYSYITIVLYAQENTELRSVLAETQKELSFATENESHTGGAETRVVQPQDENSEFIFPIAQEDYFVSSPYGVRISPFLNVALKHEGVDIGSVLRSQIVAVKPGRVITHYPAPDGYFKGHDIYGGYIVIEHKDGMITRYAHLSRTYVHEGQKIRQGEIIGRMGRTGLATGAHLHFELEIDGKTVNPLLYIENPIKE